MDHTYIYIKNTNPETGEESWRRLGLQDIHGELEILIDYGGCLGDKFVIDDYTMHGMEAREPGDEKEIKVIHSFVKTDERYNNDGDKGIFIDGKLIYEEKK
jgi:hypothetical protein